MRVDELDYAAVLSQINYWAIAQLSRFVCISTVHMIMESHDDPAFRGIINGADLVAADGIPVIWTSRKLGLRKQSRVFAPEVTLRLCEMAAQEGIPVGFYGSTPEVVADLQQNITQRFRGLVVPFCYSPPFRPLTHQEDDQIVTMINQS
jgi:N-acetylglucosaminyldiphosphoundecaprenol N-acetyl-beta-D-mannosaminyltransferase